MVNKGQLLFVNMSSTIIPPASAQEVHTCRDYNSEQRWAHWRDNKYCVVSVLPYSVCIWKPFLPVFVIKLYIIAEKQMLKKNL